MPGNGGEDAGCDLPGGVLAGAGDGVVFYAPLGGAVDGVGEVGVGEIAVGTAVNTGDVVATFEGTHIAVHAVFGGVGKGEVVAHCGY